MQGAQLAGFEVTQLAAFEVTPVPIVGNSHSSIAPLDPIEIRDGPFYLPRLTI